MGLAPGVTTTLAGSVSVPLTSRLFRAVPTENQVVPVHDSKGTKRASFNEQRGTVIAAVKQIIESHAFTGRLSRHEWTSE